MHSSPKLSRPLRGSESLLLPLTADVQDDEAWSGRQTGATHADSGHASPDHSSGCHWTSSLMSVSLDRTSVTRWETSGDGASSGVGITHRAQTVWLTSRDEKPCPILKSFISMQERVENSWRQCVSKGAGLKNWTETQLRPISRHRDACANQIVRQAGKQSEVTVVPAC